MYQRNRVSEFTFFDLFSVLRTRTAHIFGNTPSQHCCVKHFWSMVILVSKPTPQLALVDAHFRRTVDGHQHELLRGLLTEQSLPTVSVSLLVPDRMFSETKLVFAAAAHDGHTRSRVSLCTIQHSSADAAALTLFQDKPSCHQVVYAVGFVWQPPSSNCCVTLPSIRAPSILSPTVCCRASLTQPFRYLPARRLSPAMGDRGATRQRRCQINQLTGCSIVGGVFISSAGRCGSEDQQHHRQWHRSRRRHAGTCHFHGRAVHWENCGETAGTSSRIAALVCTCLVSCTFSRRPVGSILIIRVHVRAP